MKSMITGKVPNSMQGMIKMGAPLKKKADVQKKVAKPVKSIADMRSRLKMKGY